jgi:hypothetical protein
MGGTKPISVSASVPGAIDWMPVDVETGTSGRWGLSAWRKPHSSSCARSVLSSSSVRASVSVCETCFEGTGVALARAEVGTGTTRPQSGHLPATGRSVADTFSRRPHGQRNRKKPSPVSAPGAGTPGRRSRIFAPHLGQSIRSGPPGCTFSFSPQRQVTRGMRRAWRLMVHNAKNWMLCLDGSRSL